MGRERIDKELMNQVGERLREIRKNQRLTQEEIVHNTGIHPGRYERAKANIALTTLSILCTYYNISLEEFFKGIKSDTFVFERPSWLKP